MLTTVSPNKAVMLACAKTNQKYMELRVGQAGYPRLVKLYRRLADASVDLAEEYAAGDPSPSPHEPAVDAFWSAVFAWTCHFTRDVMSGHYDYEIWQTFTEPHRMFAQWLRPRLREPFYQIVALPHSHKLSPAQIILLHDYRWTIKVIELTARWGLRHHLKDLPALWQTGQLLGKLKVWPDGTGPSRFFKGSVAAAYLQSDLIFLQELFAHFQFSPEPTAIFHKFLSRAQEDLDELE